MSRLSEKQLKIMAFGYTNYDVLIADGAIRAGKSCIMIVAFIDWAMKNFNNTNFIISGKTVGSCKRNVILPYMAIKYARERYIFNLKTIDNLIIISNSKHTNYFYIFGGKDERSQSLVQGITAGGALFDEVALMPESFFNQAIARCSIENSKIWINCNPEHPEHYIYKKWILKLKKRNALHLHFLMTDNPSLSEKTIQQYEDRFDGVFYDRYIRGLWVVAEGLIYPQFSKSRHIVDEKEFKKPFSEYAISMDYGIQNPTAMILWAKVGVYGRKWHALKEYYHSGRETNEQKTDEEYYQELEKLAKGTGASTLIIDPSASSFIALVRKKGKFTVKKAKNDVLAGIQAVATCLQEDKITFSSQCTNTIKEFGLYRWDDKSKEDRVIKDNDHAQDCIRYFVYTKKLHKTRDIEQIDSMYT